MGTILEDEFRNTFSSVLFRVYFFYNTCPIGDFSLNHSWASSKWRRFLVICLSSDAWTHAWLSFWIAVGCCVHPMAFVIPRLDMTSALSVWLTALISHSAVEVDTLPWSVEHQQITDSPRHPMYDVCKWPLSWSPPRSASNWNFSWRTWVMVFISVGPSCVANFSLSSFAYLQYLRRCLRNSMCLGPGLFPYLDNMLSAYITVINVCTIPYSNCSTTLL